MGGRGKPFFSDPVKTQNRGGGETTTFLDIYSNTHFAGSCVKAFTKALNLK